MRLVKKGKMSKRDKDEGIIKPKYLQHSEVPKPRPSGLKKKPKTEWRWPASICPHCDGTLTEIDPDTRRYLSEKQFDDKCVCGAKLEEKGCPCCKRNSWVKDGIYKHQKWVHCGFTGERKK